MGYSRCHYSLVNPKADTAEDVRQRLIRRCAADRGHADMEAQFPDLTALNIREALRFQEDRIRHHERALGAR